jgi:predicted metal-binding protein
MRYLTDTDECQVQVLVCTNERQPGKACCKAVGGQEFYDALKLKLKAAGLYDTHWISRTGCLGYCNTVGTTIAIHRKGHPSRWFSEVTRDDFDAIWDEIVKS